jgi:hypothetical protein
VIFPGLDNNVYCDDNHIYWDKEGNQYESVSKFLERFYPVFDVDMMAYASAKSTGFETSKEEYKTQWKEYGEKRAGEGNALDSSIDRYERSMVILPENEDLRPVILSIVSEYKEYHKVFQQQVMYSKKHLIAGTSDKLCLFSKSPLSVVDIGDYKSYSKGLPQIDLDKHGKRKHNFMLGPLSHLIDSKFNRCALQLSMYAYLLSQQTGRRIGKLFIHLVPPDDPLTHRKIGMPYMKETIQSMLLWKETN